MNIIIKKEANMTDVFVNWLLSELKNEIIARVDSNKLNVLSSHSKDVFNTDIDIHKAFLFIVRNLKVNKIEIGYIIHLPEKITFEGVSINYLYQYINFGTLQVKGYPLISNILYNLNINRYLLKYKLIGVL